MVFSVFVVYPRLNHNCSEPYRHDLTLLIDNQPVKAEDVKTPADRDKGLGGRKCIGRDQAMLFEFDKPGSYQFWMKDMKFPIDMIWLDSSRQVVTIAPNVDPSTYPQTFVSDTPAMYVLELRSGEATHLHIRNGQTITW